MLTGLRQPISCLTITGVNHERFAEIENADFLDAGLAHFARYALEEAKIQVPLRLHIARHVDGSGAKPY